MIYRTGSGGGLLWMATLWQHICQSLWRLLILISEIQSLTSECFSKLNDLCKTNSRPHKNEIYASEFSIQFKDS